VVLDAGGLLNRDPRRAVRRATEPQHGAASHRCTWRLVPGCLSSFGRYAELEAEAARQGVPFTASDALKALLSA
jgi:hypothetical protein